MRGTMNALCAAVIALSLISVCQPAPLTCEKLLQPVDKELDVTGTWYIIAVATENCLFTTFLDAVFELSAKIHINATETPKVYNCEYYAKIFQYCLTESEKMHYKISTVMDVDANNLTFGDADVVLQSGCPDCIIFLGDSGLNATILLSRRQTVTDAELKEFKAQVDCLGWSKPWVLQTDHDYANCKTLDDAGDSIPDDFTDQMFKRLKTTYATPLLCIAYNMYQYPTSIDWFKGLW